MNRKCFRNQDNQCMKPSVQCNLVDVDFAMEFALIKFDLRFNFIILLAVCAILSYLEKPVAFTAEILSSLFP